MREQESLFEQLKSPRQHERRAAARQLGELEPTAQALAYLILEAPNLSLSRTAAEKLARLDARCAKACLLQDAVYKIPPWAAADAPGHPFLETNCTCQGGSSPFGGSSCP